MVGVFFDSVLPRFGVLFVGFSLPKMSRKNSLDVRVRCLEKFSGANFCF